MATAVADVLPELLELDKISACFEHGDLSALDGLLPAECLGLVDDLTCALVSDLPNDPDQTPLAPSTPPKATHAAAAFPDSSASASPPNERSDASEEPQHVRTVSLHSTRVATQLAQRAVATAPARGGSVSSSLGAGCGAPGDAAACSTQETQEYLLVRLDAHGRVQRQATHADMVLLSDLLQQPCPCESAEAASSGTAPACNRKPGGPCCHCGVTESPQWRRGPPSKPVLCNACGTRFRRTSQLSPVTGGVTKHKGRASTQRKRAPTASASLESCAEAPISA